MEKYLKKAILIMSVFMVALYILSCIGVFILSKCLIFPITISGYIIQNSSEYIRFNILDVFSTSTMLIPFILSLIYIASAVYETKKEKEIVKIKK